MNKLPISLCVVTHNSEDRLKDFILKHKEIVNTIVVCVQKSTDNTLEIAREYADVVVERTCKGTADPDRDFCFSLALDPWVLYLDDDEFLSDELAQNLEKLINDNVDIYWLNTINICDANGKKIDLVSILGDDPHPRLFRKGSMKFPNKIHTFPEKVGNAMVAFTNYGIVHERTLDKIKKSNRDRNIIADERSIQMQESFIAKVEELVRKSED